MADIPPTTPVLTPGLTAGLTAGPTAGLTAAISHEVASLAARPLTRGLYLVATPIGHLGDMTLRALTTLAAVDSILCEDTRHSLKLLSHYGIDRPLLPYHEHNADAVRPRILANLAKGARLALISDAGTPLVSDPGYKLVRSALEAGHAVTALPGASAVLAALTVSGLPTDSFHFAGFLPPRSGARRNRLQALAQVPGTVILFEAPTRVADTLADIAAVLPGRHVCLARELTKLHETLRRGPPLEVAAAFEADGAKGECVLLLAPASRLATVDDEMIIETLVPLLAQGPLSEAVRTVSTSLTVPRSRVYDLALTLKKGTT